MNLTPSIQPSQSKREIVEMLRQHLEAQGFTVQEVDTARPWGAFIRVANAQADKFLDTYFADVHVPENARRGERSPKFLIVAPQQRLSWQHHDRRGEYWRLVSGQAGIYTSDTNTPPDQMYVFEPGEAIELPQGRRHRLVGLDDWGIVAEIWIHADPSRPSDEADIHRHQDDYAR